MKKMISFADFEYILENRVEFNLLSKFNRTKDPELKAIISLILLAESISNGAIIALKKLTFATALEGVDLWRGKVNTRSYAKIKTIGDLKEWLRCNLVGKLITIKRHGKTRLELLIYCYQEKKIKIRLLQARSYQNDLYNYFLFFMHI
jgi:hypothetical protein